MKARGIQSVFQGSEFILRLKKTFHGVSENCRLVSGGGGGYFQFWLLFANIFMLLVKSLNLNSETIVKE